MAYMWKLVGASIVVLTVACSGGDDDSEPRSSVSATPTAVPAVITATETATVAPATRTPSTTAAPTAPPTPDAVDPLATALSELDRSMREAGGSLSVLGFVPEGFDLESAEPVRGVNSVTPSAHLRYRGTSGQSVFLDVRQYPLSALSGAIGQTAVDAAITYRSVFQTRPDDDNDRLFVQETVPNAGFSLAFEHDGAIFNINGEIHACIPGCDFSWCAADACRTFPEPVIRAIAESIVPYSGK